MDFIVRFFKNLLWIVGVAAFLILGIMAVVLVTEKHVGWGILLGVVLIAAAVTLLEWLTDRN